MFVTKLIEDSLHLDMLLTRENDSSIHTTEQLILFHYYYFHFPTLCNNSLINSLSFFKLYLENLLFTQKKWLPMESALHLWAHLYRRNIKVTMRLHCASEVSQNLFTKEVTMNSIIQSLLFGEAFQVFSPNILG